VRSRSPRVCIHYVLIFLHSLVSWNIRGLISRIRSSISKVQQQAGKSFLPIYSANDTCLTSSLTAVAPSCSEQHQHQPSARFKARTFLTRTLMSFQPTRSHVASYVRRQTTLFTRKDLVGGWTVWILRFTVGGASIIQSMIRSRGRKAGRGRYGL
jgi:hypothetical protein